MASAKSWGVKRDRLACAESIDERDREIDWEGGSDI